MRPCNLDVMLLHSIRGAILRGGFIKRMKQKKAEEELERDVARVADTMALSGMSLTEEEKEALRRIGRGELSSDEHLQRVIDKAKEIGKKYGRPDAMKLSIEDRRKLMDWIMENAREAADDAAKVFIQNNPFLSPEDLEDEVIDVRFKSGLARMLELQEEYGFPIPGYDRNTKRAYIEYSGGSKEFVEDIINNRIENGNPEME